MRLQILHCMYASTGEGEKIGRQSSSTPLILSFSLQFQHKALFCQSVAHSPSILTIRIPGYFSGELSCSQMQLLLWLIWNWNNSVGGQWASTSGWHLRLCVTPSRFNAPPPTPPQSLAGGGIAWLCPVDFSVMIADCAYSSPLFSHEFISIIIKSNNDCGIMMQFLWIHIQLDKHTFSLVYSVESITYIGVVSFEMY